MEAAEVRRAVAAARATADGLGLAVDDASVISDSNRLVLRLLPCDVVARVASTTHFTDAAREVDLVARLGATGSPVAPLDPRVEPQVVEQDGFEITLWAHLDADPDHALPPADYVQALQHLHAGLRQIDLIAPHCMDRVVAVRRDVVDREATPDLTDVDRALLAATLRDRRQAILDRRAPEQLLHGEPHPWNVLATDDGLFFIDFENAALGPVEYDLAWVPEAVSERYGDVDRSLLEDCRGIVLAIIATHRWHRDDQHPSGRTSGVAFLDALRQGPPWPALDEVTW